MPVLRARYPTAEPTLTGTPYQSAEGATPAAFGAGIGTALGQLGEAFGRAGDVATKLQSEYDKTAALEASNWAQAATQRRLYGDPLTEDTGYFGKQGRAAMDARPSTTRDVLSDFTTARERLSPAQRRLFDLDTHRTILHAQAQIAQHASKEFRTYQNDTDEAKVKLSGNRITNASVAGDTETFHRELGDQLLQVRDYGQRNGWSDEQIKAEQEKRTALAAESWVHGLGAREQPEGAVTFLKQNPHLFATDAAKYETLLNRYTGAADERIASRAVEQYRPTNAPKGGGAAASEHYNHLISIGATPNEAALLTSAAQVESNFNPEATHDAATLAKRGLPPGYGLYGHNAERLAAMKEKYGPRPTWQQQNQFALDELRSRPEGARVNAAKTPEELAALQEEFEQPKRTPEGTRKRVETTRAYMTKGAAVEEPITAIGDSLTSHLVTFGGAQGKTDRAKIRNYREGDTAVSDFKPQEILDTVIPKLPKALVEGKPVTLSTGISNLDTPEEIEKALTETIPAQIAALREQKAKNIVLMGVGTHPKLAGVNDRLAQIAQQNAGAGVTFSGAIDPVSGDQIHFGEKGAPTVMAQVKAALPGAPAAEVGPSTKGPTDYRAWADAINHSNLTDAQKEAAIKRIRREQSDSSLGQEQAKSDLIIDLQNGRATLEDIERLAAEQRISPAARTQAREILRKIDEEKADAAQAIARVSAAGNGGPPLDPKDTYDRKALNFHYEAASALWPPAEAVDRAVAYATQYGLVPDKLKSTIRGGLHSGQPAQVALAADTVARLRNVNPQLVGELGDENDLRLANLVGSYTSAGVPADQAITLATEGMKVSKAEREARTQDFEAQRGKTTKERSDSDDRWIRGQQDSFWSRDPNVDPVMRQEFVEVAKAEFERTGNLEAARRTALDQINRVWGRSTIGGDLRYMKFAPENYYKVPGLSPAENTTWMNEQLLADVNKGRPPDQPVKAAQLRLYPDPTQSDKGLPVYQVWIQRPDSAVLDQYRDASGKPMRWRPDWNTSPHHEAWSTKAAEAAAQGELARQQEMERARRHRRELIEQPLATAPISPSPVATAPIPPAAP